MIIQDASKFGKNATKFVLNTGKFVKDAGKFLKNKKLKKSNKDYGTLVNLPKTPVRKEFLTSVFSKDADKKKFFLSFFQNTIKYDLSKTLVSF